MNASIPVQEKLSGCAMIDVDSIVEGIGRLEEKIQDVISMVLEDREPARVYRQEAQERHKHLMGILEIMARHFATTQQSPTRVHFGSV